MIIGAPARPEMRIFVPFTTIQPATMLSLLWYLPHTTFVDCNDDPWGYVEYLQRLWDSNDGKFINIEHDVVPAPGVIDEMWHCTHAWCVNEYIGPPAPTGIPSFGAVKIGSIIPTMIPYVWSDWRGHSGYKWRERHPTSKPWYLLDVWFGEYMRDTGITPHYHWPQSVNAQPDADPVFAPVKIWRDGAVHHGSRQIDITVQTM